jgi:S1-C subfamily serine protease
MSREARIRRSRRSPTAVLSALLVLLSLSLPAGKGLPAEAKSPVARMKESVVRVVCMTGDSDGEAGSGFAVGDGRVFVTNWHVVEGVGNGGRPGILDEEGSLLPCVLLAHSEEKDLALLRCAGGTAKTPVRFASASGIEVGQDVIAMGYPGASDIVEDDFAAGLGGITVTKGTFRGLNRAVSGRFSRIFPVHPACRMKAGKIFYGKIRAC